MSTIELNLDGLVGPTHHYAGLAFGNNASTKHAHQVSYPRAAALQGLEKMRLLMSLGIEQAFLPPPMRPNLALLNRLGFSGPNQLKNAFEHAPQLLSACFSASSMWCANAATVSPAADTSDGKIHFTPANLVSQLHRSQEAEHTFKMLKTLFHDERFFTVHAPLPANMTLADEGAANANRLCPAHAEAGVNCFVYGKSTFPPNEQRPHHYPARQSKEAQQAITRLHGLKLKHTFFLQQAPEAIDAGVFHNDVISLANEDVFLVHEHAFVNQKAQLEAIKKAAGFDIKMVEVSNRQLPLKEAVASYFFNSQLISRPQQSMTLIAPQECEDNPKALALIQNLCASTDIPIDTVHFVNLKQSMQNGGGPACLRLRIPLSQSALATIPQGFRLTPHRLKSLINWVEKHYREQLYFHDLCDPELPKEVQQADVALWKLINA